MNHTQMICSQTLNHDERVAQRQLMVHHSWLHLQTNTQNYNNFKQSEQSCHYYSATRHACRRKVMSTSSIIHIPFEKRNVREI